MKKNESKFNIIHFNEIDSTNTYVLKNYKNLNNYDVIIAEIQTGGRGRRDNKWISSDKDNLYFSFVIKPDKKINYSIAELSQLAALSIYDTIIGIFNDKLYFRKELKNNLKSDAKSNSKSDIENGLKNLKNFKNPVNNDLRTIFKDEIINDLKNNLKIKWPNDIYVQDKKLSGILIETVLKESNVEVIVIGIGINLNSDESFLKLINKKATSIYVETGMKINKISFLYNLVENIINYYEIWLKKGFDNFYNKWEKIIDLVGRDIVVMINNKETNCKVKNILPDFKAKVKVNNSKSLNFKNLEEYIIDLSQVIIQ